MDSQELVRSPMGRFCSVSKASRYRKRASAEKAVSSSDSSVVGETASHKDSSALGEGRFVVFFNLATSLHDC